MKPTYFDSADAFRTWLTKHGASTTELWVAFYKKDSGWGGITYKEAVDEALCFGWIDGIKKRVDELSYMHRFTPRQAKSTWSAVNIARVGELTKLGRMTKAGLDAFAARTAERSGIYAYEQRDEAQFDAALEKRFRASKKAWEFFHAQPPGYRKLMTFWVMDAKKAETREKRLEKLIGESAAGRRLR